MLGNRQKPFDKHDYRYLAGDECTALISETNLQHCRRAGDVAILPNTKSAEAIEIAEPTRQGVDALHNVHETSEVKKIVPSAMGLRR